MTVVAGTKRTEDEAEVDDVFDNENETEHALFKLPNAYNVTNNNLAELIGNKNGGNKHK